jgi:hypothetical protein
MMAITGSHMLLYSCEAEALRVMLRDAFGLKSVDAGHGWLIFKMPPSELGVHPTEGSASDSRGVHQISFMCDNIHATVAELRKKGVEFVGEPKNEGFGIVVTMVLPGEVRVLLYEPRHAVALDV